MKIAIINGPNLNLLGHRETQIYGSLTLNDIETIIRKNFPSITFVFFQSNIEGEIVNQIQECALTCDAIIINPAAYTHTSIAIADAIASTNKPIVEVHLSNIHARENFRHSSITGAKCKGIICGFGYVSYLLAVQAILFITKGND